MSHRKVNFALSERHSNLLPTLVHVLYPTPTPACPPPPKKKKKKKKKKKMKKQV